MGLHLSLRVVLFLIRVIYAQNNTVFAQQNITINENDTSITYSPPVGNSSTTGWSQYTGNPLDTSSSHMLTQLSNATASFNFTGIAIYFIAPLWPYQVTTNVSLDSGPNITIDLQDRQSSHTGGDSETGQYRPVWNATGLANTQHNLLISVGPGGYGVVDGLTYTIATNASSSSLLPTPTSNDPIVASSTAVTSSPKSKSKSVVAIALGSLFGIFGLLVGVWYFFRRRKRPILGAWAINHAPHATSMSRNISTSAVGPNPTNMGNRSAAGRLSDDYELDYTISTTTTERSTPQMAEGMPLLATAPPPYESEAGCSTAAQGPEASHGVSRIRQLQQKPGMVVLEYNDSSH